MDECTKKRTPAFKLKYHFQRHLVIELSVKEGQRKKKRRKRKVLH